MKLDEIKQGLSSIWESVAEGWQHLRQSASSALTSFKPGEHTNLPGKSDIDDAFYLPSMGWSMLGGNVFEDAERIVVRLELPGMNKENLDLEVHEGKLIVRGEKHFERENTEGRYRTFQCAYGSFERSVALPGPVHSEQAKATYDKGVLRVELPKAEPVKPRKLAVRID